MKIHIVKCKRKKLVEYAWKNEPNGAVYLRGNRLQSSLKFSAPHLGRVHIPLCCAYSSKSLTLLGQDWQNRSCFYFALDPPSPSVWYLVFAIWPKFCHRWLWKLGSLSVRVSMHFPFLFCLAGCQLISQFFRHLWQNLVLLHSKCSINDVHLQKRVVYVGKKPFKIQCSRCLKHNICAFLW